MAQDFGYVWRTVRLYCPAAPTFLAREWVNAAWKQLLAARRWGFLRKPISFTCDGVNPYVVMPPDFAMFEYVVNPTLRRKISFTHSLDELTKVDPGFIAMGPPGALIAVSPSTDPATLGQAQYQYYPMGYAQLQGMYYSNPGRLTDTFTLPLQMADGAEVLVAGALAHAALWPGTGEKPNPYFNAGLAQTKTEEFKLGVQMLSLRDDEIYPDDLWDNHWPYADCGLLGLNPDIRATDFPYDGSYGYGW